MTSQYTSHPMRFLNFCSLHIQGKQDLKTKDALILCHCWSSSKRGVPGLRGFSAFVRREIGSAAYYYQRYVCAPLLSYTLERSCVRRGRLTS